MQYEQISSIFNDIVNGYSKFSFENNYLFIKHHDLNLELKSSQIYIDFFEKYKQSGLPTLEERLEFLKEEGDWSDKDEKSIQSQKLYLENLKKTKANLVIKSQIKEIEKTIKDSEASLAEKIFKREFLIGSTCEKNALKNKEEYQILKSIFKDENLNNYFFSELDWELLEDNEIRKIINIYYNVFEKFSDKNLKILSLHPLFYNYFVTCDKFSSYKFFSESPSKLTFFQQKLLNFARNIRLIFENCDIPNEIKDNYDDIMEFYRKQNEQKNPSKNKQNNASSIVGANKSEMQKAGINTAGTITPFDMLKKQGKASLNKKDFLNAMNPV